VDAPVTTMDFMRSSFLTSVVRQPRMAEHVAANSPI
jgi:hypothetical protein